MVGSKDPVVERGKGPRFFRPWPHRRDARAPVFAEIKQRRRTCVQKLLGAELLEFVADSAQRAFAYEFGRAKFARRKIQRREARPGFILGALMAVAVCSRRRLDRHQRCEKIIFLRSQRRIGGGARRDHACDLAPHQLFRQTGIFHLLADCDLIPAAD